MNKKLKNMIKLRAKITVYIPSTHEIDKRIDNTEYVEECAKMLSEQFGGATSTPALGYWMSQDKGLIKEKTVMVFAYAKDKDLDNSLDVVVEFCEKLKKELSQEAIAIEVNGEMYFI